MGILHNYGEEYFQKQGLNPGDITTTNCYVGIYLDDETEGGDNLSDSDNIDAITTEPNDGNYQRLEVGLDSNNIEIVVDGVDAQAVFNTLELDITNTTGEADSWFIVIEYESDYAEDTEPSENLIMSGRFDVAEPQQLDNLNIVELDNVGGTLS